MSEEGGLKINWLVVTELTRHHCNTFRLVAPNYVVFGQCVITPKLVILRQVRVLTES